MVCAKSTWKTSAAAIKEISKGEFLCLSRNRKTLFVSKDKNFDRICLVEKLRSTTATKFFFLRTATEHNSVLFTGGRNRSSSVEEITQQVPSLGPPFGIFIDLCSCDFQAAESFT